MFYNQLGLVFLKLDSTKHHPVSRNDAPYNHVQIDGIYQQQYGDRAVSESVQNVPFNQVSS